MVKRTVKHTEVEVDPKILHSSLFTKVLHPIDASCTISHQSSNKENHHHHHTDIFPTDRTTRPSTRSTVNRPSRSSLVSIPDTHPDQTSVPSTANRRSCPSRLTTIPPSLVSHNLSPSSAPLLHTSTVDSAAVVKRLTTTQIRSPRAVVIKSYATVGRHCHHMINDDDSLSTSTIDSETRLANRRVGSSRMTFRQSIKSEEDEPIHSSSKRRRRTSTDLLLMEATKPTIYPAVDGPPSTSSSSSTATSSCCTLPSTIALTTGGGDDDSETIVQLTTPSVDQKHLTCKSNDSIEVPSWRFKPLSSIVANAREVVVNDSMSSSKKREALKVKRKRPGSSFCLDQQPARKMTRSSLATCPRPFTSSPLRPSSSTSCFGDALMDHDIRTPSSSSAMPISHPFENEIGEAVEDASDSVYETLHQKLELDEIKHERRARLLSQQHEFKLRLERREKLSWHKRRSGRLDPFVERYEPARRMPNRLCPGPLRVREIRTLDGVPVVAFGCRVPSNSLKRFAPA